MAIRDQTCIADDSHAARRSAGDFLLMNIVPGDIALLIIGGDQGGDINPRELAKLRAQLGLDRPLYMQFSPGSGMWSGWISASRCGLGRRSWKNSGFASPVP